LISHGRSLLIPAYCGQGAYPGSVFELERIDLEEIATALQDQKGYEYRWTINVRTGEINFDGECDFDDEEPEDSDLIRIIPLPARVWYRDMAYFARHISDQRAGEWLSRAIDGRGAFSRFNNQLHQRFPDLVPSWRALRENRAMCRAVEWLADQGLIDAESLDRFVAEHPEPELP
jgi:hypothetical protein